MDVRCENCKTEYELEESRLKPGGITVKCANCGHMFKIRKRPDTASFGAPNPQSNPPAAPRSKPRTVPPPAPGSGAVRRPSASGAVPKPAPSVGSGAKSRTWLIRLTDGDIKTCQELKILQGWIVAGKVTRDAHISRNGKTWKPLGAIAELESYFTIADEAQQGAPPPSVKKTLMNGSAPPVPAKPKPAPKPEPVPEPEPEPMPAVSPAKLAATVGATPPPTGPSSPTVLEGPNAEAPPAAEAPVLPSSPPPDSGPAGRSTGSWAAQARQSMQRAATDEEAAGPIGGLSKGVPTADVAFASSAKQRPFGGTFDDELASDMIGFDDDPFTQRKGGAGKWIVGVSLLVLGGAAAAIYFLVIKPKDDKKTTAAAHAAVIDAGVANASDAGAPTAANGKAEALSIAQKQLLADDQAGLNATRDILAKLKDADTDVGILVTRARVEASAAHSLALRARLEANPAAAKKLNTDARKRATAGMKLAKKATSADKKDLSAQAVTAELMRLQGKRTRDVERVLRKVLRSAPKHRDARLTRARLLIRDNKLPKARTLLGALDSGDGALEKSGDVRPRLDLALIQLENKKHEEAKAAANAVLSAQAEHIIAKVVLARIAQETKVATDTTDTTDSTGGAGANNTGGGAPSIDAYDGLVSKADKMARNGKCKGAMKLYRRALDANPAGVAALTGMGYCHINFRQYASAHGKFRAALGVSSRYQEALYGIAEAYQQQGLKPQAIAAFKRYISAHPNSGRAKMARRQIERMGGSVDKPGGDKPGGDKPGGDKPGGDKPGGDKPGGGKPGGDKPSGDKPSGDKPSGDKPKPSGDKPSSDKPSGDKPKPSGDKSGDDKPKPKPTADKPKPAPDKPKPTPTPKPAPSTDKPAG